MINIFVSIIGAICLAALREFDEASIFSIILVLIGVTSLLYGVRHTNKTKENVFIAILFVIVYIIRFYDYTESHLLDLLLGLLIGLIMYLILSFERLFKKQEQHFWYTFIYPSFYLLFLYFSEIVKINMPFRLDTYFTCVPVLCQIVSIFGTYILNFLLAWTASVIVFVIDYKNNKDAKVISTLYIVIMIFIVVYGTIHYNNEILKENNKKNTVRIACATGPDNYAYENSLDNPTINENIEILKESVEKASKQDTDILLFCEEAFGVADYDESFFVDNAKQFAKEYKIQILLAYEVADTNNDTNGKSINKLCYIDENGEVIYEYTKHCIVPFIETQDYIRGEKQAEPFEVTINGNTYTIGAVICYDTDYDCFMSTIGKDVDLLLIPTWDWKVVKEEHFSVAILRAIASNTTIVRSTYDGYTAVIDQAGNVLEKDETVNVNNNMIVYDVPIQ